MKKLLISTMIASTLLLGACATHNNVRPVYVEDWERVQYGFIEDIAYEQAHNGANGHQLRRDRGNAETVAVSAVVADSLEQNRGTSNRMEARIRLDSGTSITHAQENLHGFRKGDRVRIEGGRVVRG